MRKLGEIATRQRKIVEERAAVLMAGIGLIDRSMSRSMPNVASAAAKGGLVKKPEEVR
jgi:hypothetical protein